MAVRRRQKRRKAGKELRHEAENNDGIDDFYCRHPAVQCVSVGRDCIRQAKPPDYSEPRPSA